MTKDEILTFLRGKLSNAQQTLLARQQMENNWLVGTNASWRAVGCKLNKAQRLEQAKLQGRIAQKIQRDVEMFQAAIAAIERAGGL